MLIRQEKQEDRSYIATLIARTYGSAGAKIIEQTGQLRALGVYASELSFVAEEEGKPAAFALMTPVAIAGEMKGVVLAPLALDIHNTNFDIAGFLSQVFDALSAKGFSYVFAMGSLDDLSPLGFVYADSLGLKAHQDIDASLLVKHIADDVLQGDVSIPEVLLG